MSELNYLDLMKAVVEIMQYHIKATEHAADCTLAAPGLSGEELDNFYTAEIHKVAERYNLNPNLLLQIAGDALDAVVPNLPEVDPDDPEVIISKAIGGSTPYNVLHTSLNDAIMEILGFNYDDEDTHSNKLPSNYVYVEFGCGMDGFERVRYSWKLNHREADGKIGQRLEGHVHVVDVPEL